VLECFCSMT